MKYGRVTAGSFAAVLSPLAGIAASLAGALPARGAEVPFTERVISTTADSARSVFATDVDGDGVDDAIDVCDNTPPGTAVDAAGRPLGDVDQDCDTDLEDHALSQQGFTGPLGTFGGFMETVLVDNRGNAGESSGFGKTCICGGVDYVYKIGKFEVTAGEYAEFLNAVAATDTYGLYNSNMGISGGCRITRNGTSGSYTYDFSGRPSGTEADWLDRPVNWVSWGDAARFANWMHNGQPTGDQDTCTTEDGSYELFGATSHEDLQPIRREPDATWVIPSEDEWYKAAYHKNDGVTGNYYGYPTSSDGVPSNALIDPDPGNSATIWDGGWTIGSPFFRTEGGAHENSASPYGTFDQGGNVWEWNEAANGSFLGGGGRGFRGGSWDDSEFNLRSSIRDHQNPTTQDGIGGFRVAKRR